MSVRARRLLAGLLTAVVGMPLWAGVTVTEPAAADPAVVTVPLRYLQQEVRWQACDIDFYLHSIDPDAPQTRCTELVVPMDWQHPDAHPDITVAISLSRATGRSQGLLVMNPGGPGLAGLSTTALLATERPRMFSDFDLLGLDPRGFGASQPAQCGSSEAALESLPSVADPRVRSKASHRAEVARARYEATACHTELNRYVGTQQTVHDLEFVRAYLAARRPAGDRLYDRLNYVGFSYGTWLGAWYADSYPGRTGRFILDSNMDWTSTMAANQALDSASFQRRRDEMFFPWVARHHATYRLGSTAAAVRKRYEQIRAGVLRSFRQQRSPATATDLDAAISGQLYSDVDLPAAAETLLEYAALAASDSSVGRRHGPAPDARVAEDYTWDAGLAVRCNDTAWSRDIAATLRRSDADARRYRFIGYRNTVSMCHYWSAPATRRTVDLAGAPTVLMIQSEGDPATAYEGALAAHRATAGRTRLVSVADSGQHGVYLSDVSPCVDRIGDAFLFEGRLPRADTTCTSRPLPRERRVYPLAGPVTGRGSSATERSPEASAASSRVVQRIRDEAAQAEAR